MPSRHFASRARRQHSGRQTENSEHWIRGEYAAEPSAPTSIANSVDLVASRGKKTGIVKDQEHAKRRLKLDTTQADIRRSERKHMFPEHPQSQRNVEQMRQLSPRLLPQSVSQVPHDGGSQGSRTPCFVDVQHRTSAEMVASMMPEMSTAHHATSEAIAFEQRKYFVGDQIVSWANSGRRGAPLCHELTAQVAAEAAAEAGARPAFSPLPPQRVPHPAENAANLRDHCDPDTILVAPQVARNLVPQVLPTRSPPTRMAPVVMPPPAPPFAESSGDGSVHAFGEYSSLPSTMAKDTAYLHSGLKVVKYGSRTPGFFSPQMARVSATQALA